MYCLDYPYKGALTIIFVYIIATVLFVPASLLTLGAGYAIGTAFDSVTYGVFVASTVRIYFIPFLGAYFMFLFFFFAYNVFFFFLHSSKKLIK